MNNNTAADKDDVEEITRSNLTLTISGKLEAGSAGMIQVPAELLNSLLVSIEGMKKQLGLVEQTVEDLKGQNSQLQTKLSLLDSSYCILAGNTGSRFFWFRKLPPEIQNKIWNWAGHLCSSVIALKPKAGADTDGFVHLIPTALSKPFNPLLETCRNARREAIACQKTIYSKFCSYGDHYQVDDEFLVSSNSTTDILWFPFLGFSGLSVRARPIVWESTLMCKMLETLNVRYITPRLIAFSVNLLFDYERFIEPLLKILLANDIEEIFLVVGGDKVYNSPEVVFVKPRKCPEEMSKNFTVGLNYTEISEAQKRSYQLRGIFWEDLVEAANEYIEQVATKPDRKRVELRKQGLTEEKVQQCVYDEYGDRSKWTTIKIRFVEAVTMTEQKEEGLSPLWRV